MNYETCGIYANVLGDRKGALSAGPSSGAKIDDPSRAMRRSTSAIKMTVDCWEDEEIEVSVEPIATDTDAAAKRAAEKAALEADALVQAKDLFCEPPADALPSNKREMDVFCKRLVNTHVTPHRKSKHWKMFLESLAAQMPRAPGPKANKPTLRVDSGLDDERVSKNDARVC